MVVPIVLSFKKIVNSVELMFMPLMYGKVNILLCALQFQIM